MKFIHQLQSGAVQTDPTADNSTPIAMKVERDKRTSIIEAARALFTGSGYESTTMAEVARNAGVAVGTVYLYFKNKGDLLIAVKEDWEAEMLRAAARPDVLAMPHNMRARPIIEACFDICSRNTEMVQLMALQPEMLGKWRGHPSPPIRALLRNYFDDAIEAGAIRAVDSERAAVLAYGMVSAALQECFVVHDGGDPSEYVEALIDAFEHWLIKPELRRK